MEDEKIIELYWQRSETAVAESDAKYGAYCRSIAMNLLRQREDTEECVADTWMSAWRSMPPQRPNRLSVFLGRITRNGALDRLREKNRLKRGRGIEPLPLDELAECVPAPHTVETELEDREIAAVISAWLRSLSPEKRGAFVRRYWYFDSVDTVAARFGYGRQKTASILYRLRQDLKNKLENEGIVV